MTAKFPRSLRNDAARHISPKRDIATSGALTAACLAVSGSATTADAQSALPAVTVNAPVVRPRPVAAPKPSPAQVKARTAIRRKVQQPVQARAVPVRGPVVAARPAPAPVPAQTLPTFARAVDASPYTQPGAPYKANRVQSGKITEPIANTPRTITVLTKEALRDKEATSLRELGRSTAGVTLGTGEGGNAFGDRFFIRGFDARNDVFIDGIRDPGVSVRENFFTEQVEILRGPGSTFAGRGTTGGAINIVTKQATTDRDFRIIEATGSPSERGGRVTIDVNQAISPVLAVRANGLYQDAKVAGRNFVTDDRWGFSGSVVFKPIEPLTLTASYTHVDLRGLPDFGVPYNRAFNRPFTEGLLPRNTYYGFIYRDFQKVRQDFATITGDYKFNENITLSTKFRRSRALLNYVGTLAEAPNLLDFTIAANPQSRYQTVGMFANQTDATVKFDTGPIRHTSVIGAELSHEQIFRDTYSGLASEQLPGGFTGAGSLRESLFAPLNTLPFGTRPVLTGNPTIVPIDTKSAYLIHTANYQDFLILNGGVRFDDYRISSYGIGTFARNHSKNVNYNAGLVFKPIPIVSFYGALATSSNPVGAEVDGTTAQYGGLNAADQIFGPERNKAIEVGAKFELLDRRLLATAALFRTTKENAREIIGAGAAATVTANAAYQVQGVDFEVAGKLTERWSVLGGLVLMQSKVTKSSFPTNVGLPLANVAHASFSLLTKYQLFDQLEVGGQAVYNSRRYGGTFLAANGGSAFNAAGLPAPTLANPFLNVPTVLPSYWRFDTFAEAKLVEGVTAKISVQNLFNRTYYDAFYQSATPFAQIAPGRSVAFSVRAVF